MAARCGLGLLLRGIRPGGSWAFGKKRRASDLIPLLGTLRQFRDHVPRVVYELYPVA